MAHFCIKSHAELGPHTVLAPERYDPRRSLRHRVESATVPLQEVVTFQRTLMLPKQAAQSQGLFQVLDTSDAKSGLIQGPGHQLRGDELGSAKKRVRTGQVLISRLRPYLRQVAFIDAGAHRNSSENLPLELLCSTEFFVLRPLCEEEPGPNGAERSIAFLVPYLLSAPVQRILAAAQEGGHHPRFSEETLRMLPIPSALLQKRDAVSAAVERSVARYRQSQASLQALEHSTGALLEPPDRA